MKKRIKIDGMSCEHCVMHVESALNELGAKHIHVNLLEGYAEADLDCPDDKIREAIYEAGYEVIEIE